MMVAASGNVVVVYQIVSQRLRFSVSARFILTKLGKSDAPKVAPCTPDVRMPFSRRGKVEFH